MAKAAAMAVAKAMHQVHARWLMANLERTGTTNMAANGWDFVIKLLAFSPAQPLQVHRPLPLPHVLSNFFSKGRHKAGEVVKAISDQLKS